MSRGLFLFLLLLGQVLQAQNLSFVKAEVASLTDSSLHGRGYVLNGSNLAADYIADRFAAIGVEPASASYFQPFNLDINVFDSAVEMRVDGAPLRVGHDFIADSRSGTTLGTYRIIRFDSTDFQPDSKRPDLGSKVAVVDMEGMNSPEEMTALHELKLAILGSRPLLLLQPDKLTWSAGMQEYPQAVLEVLRSAFPERARSVQIELYADQRSFEARNVVGKILGKRSDSCLVISAHYDHLGRLGEAIFPGASDNASGVATMLDLARHYMADPPEFDIWFIAFAAEEAGLKGSKYFVDHPLMPLDRIKLLINLDLMGSAAKGITVVNGRLYPKLMSELAAINSKNDLVPKIKLRGKAANSDHYWFSEAGVPAIFIYTEGSITAYHDVNDTAGGLDWANYDNLFTLLTTFISTR